MGLEIYVLDWRGQMVQDFHEREIDSSRFILVRFVTNWKRIVEYERDTRLIYSWMVLRQTPRVRKFDQGRSKDECSFKIDRDEGVRVIPSTEEKS
jgi:hypothetical protein